MSKYCRQCGGELQDGKSFCANCGAPVNPDTVPISENNSLRCSMCGSTNINIQTVQENVGGVTVTKTKSKYKEKRHGLIWWLCVGWWWWIIDLFLWIFLFIPRAIIHLGRNKKYKGKSKSVSTTKNKILYRTVCTCQNCGNSWVK